VTGISEQTVGNKGDNNTMCVQKEYSVFTRPMTGQQFQTQFESSRKQPRLQLFTDPDQRLHVGYKLLDGSIR